MGGDRNRVRIVSKSGVEEWPEMGKDEVAARLAELIAERLKTIQSDPDRGLERPSAAPTVYCGRHGLRCGTTFEKRSATATAANIQCVALHIDVICA